MSERCYSYHIFYFPFKWELPGEEKKLFSEQVDLKHIPITPYSMWERKQITPSEKIVSNSEQDQKEATELFAEQQYYFEFVHPVLYDVEDEANPIIAHFERREPKGGEVQYIIQHGQKEYILHLDSINLNLYSTGVGIMSFYMSNRREDQKNESSVRDINQFGRRIMPPHCGEIRFGRRGMLAERISIKGLHNDVNQRYSDSYEYSADGKSKFGLANKWQPAAFICNLIDDLSPGLKVTPVIDDRMLVNCWYGNNELSNEIKYNSEEFMNSPLWYKYVFVDSGDEDWDVTCQNDEMKRDLINDSTYMRWQNFGTLYGITRYSMVILTDESDFSMDIVAIHMRTIYSRMFELGIIQRASMLRFSGEVTRVSALGQDNKIIASRIGSIYKEYIRFVNQIYFRSVTAQDQGIEIYEKLLKQFNSKELITDLDDEIGELHQYITLLIEQKRNENSEWLNTLATIFLPATVIAGLFGMNSFRDSFEITDFMGQFLFIVVFSILIYCAIKKRRK